MRQTPSSKPGNPLPDGGSYLWPLGDLALTVTLVATLPLAVAIAAERWKAAFVYASMVLVIDALFVLLLVRSGRSIRDYVARLNDPQALR